MSWDAVAAIAEAVGALAVVVTLLYLATQIRQNTENARAATELEVSRRFSYVSDCLLHDRELQRIWDAVASGEDLTPEDCRHYMWLVDWFFHTAGGVFVQHRHGFLSDETWEVWERGMWGLLQQPPVRDWWENENAPLPPEFRRFVNSLLEGDLEFRLPSFVDTLGSAAAPSTGSPEPS